MMQRILFSLLFLSQALCMSIAMANTDELGLPTSFERNDAIQSPEAFWGFGVGEYHPRHDEIVAYFKHLDAASDRVSVEITGYSHDRRPLMIVTFSKPGTDVAAVRGQRAENAREAEGPLVVWMGYSVHGNEASAASAAVQTAWYLAASEDEQVINWLDQMVIVMEPVLNPDGHDRFAHWVNMHRGQHPSKDPLDREHNEIWPNGRTNYYWFDLNRDWMPLVHPESKARMAQYYAWQPHVVTDFHEMGPNSTYFFQPGVPERNNPLTPTEVFDLTAAIARHHAEALDQAKEPYYTRESFDDYYVGKGSTYPDLTGGIGILFEQGSARGHIQATEYGDRTFADAIANQVRTSVSSLKGAAANAKALKDYQASFFASARQLAKNSQRAGWVFSDGGDPGKAQILINRLLHHQITIHPATEAVTIDGQEYSPSSAWVVPADQDQYRLISSLFDLVTELSMETFYDVSTWPLGLSYDVPVASVRRLPAMGQALNTAPEVSVSAIDDQAVAWLVPWDQYHAPAVLAHLLAEGYRVQVATDPVQLTRQSEAYVRGSLIVHPGIQPNHLPSVGEVLANLSQDRAVEVVSLASGLVTAGPDVGSPSAPVIPHIRPAMLVGEGVNVYNAGYIWHWFDAYLGQPIAKIDTRDIGRVDWSDYTHVILPEGSYQRLPSSFAQALADFVRSGGSLLAARSAAQWVEGLDLGWSWVKAGEDSNDTNERRAYEDHTLDFAREVIGGSALAMDLDITHPLGYGYSDSNITVFRRGRHQLKEDTNHYSRAGVYQDPVLRSGYLGANNRSALAGTPALVATRHGRGVVVRMADDYLFRGYWLGSERLFANALFFSPLIGTTRLPSE